jgi:hypothetical protein
VTETADLSGDVRFRRLLFEAANQKHLAIEFERLLTGKSTEPILLSFFDFVSFLFKFFGINVGGCIHYAGRALLLFGFGG